MPRLIDAEKLRKDVLDLPNCYNGFSDSYDKAMIIDLVDEQPTVDIDSLIGDHEDIGYEKGRRDGYAEALEATDNTEPVRHGHWEWHEDECDYLCSNCKRFVYSCSLEVVTGEYKFCPHCGAKMDEEEEE